MFHIIFKYELIQLIRFGHTLEVGSKNVADVEGQYFGLLIYIYKLVLCVGVCRHCLIVNSEENKLTQ